MQNHAMAAQHSGDTPHKATPIQAHAIEADPIEAVIATVRELTEIMSREVELLRAMKVRDFSELQDRKTVLVGTYESLTKELAGRPEFFASIDPRLKAELRDITERMHGVMDTNAAAIRAAQAVNQKIANAIVDAVQSQSVTQGYSSGGAVTAQRAGPPVSVQVDRVS